MAGEVKVKSSRKLWETLQRYWAEVRILEGKLSSTEGMSDYEERRGRWAYRLGLLRRCLIARKEEEFDEILVVERTSSRSGASFHAP